MAEKKKKRGRPPSSKNKKKKVQPDNLDHAVKDDLWAIVIIALGAFLLLAFQTKIAGALGAGLSDIFKGCFGAIAYIFPYYLALYGLLLLIRKVTRISGRSIVLLLVIFFMVAFINSARFIDSHNVELSWKAMVGYYESGIQLNSGGTFGMYIGGFIVKGVGVPGLYIFSIAILLICVLLILNTPFSRFFQQARERRKLRKEEQYQAEEEQIPAPAPKEKTPRPKKEQKKDETNYVPGRISDGQRNILGYMKDETLFDQAEESYGIEDIDETPSSGFGIDPPLGLEEKGPGTGLDPISDPEPESHSEPELVAEVPKKSSKAEAEKATIPEEEIVSKPVNSGNYKLPSIELLNKNTASKGKAGATQLKMKAAKLEETLRNFNIDARVINVTQGPAVTRYEIQPNVGVKVKSITNLADDIALNLEAKSIRIEAPIPGKAAVGIEVENDRVTMVTLREIIDSKEFKVSKSKITFVVGKDISGHAIVADLKSMPHLLIAGSTGSGKSVCINSIITSILYKANPDEVKLVLIDPKVVELSNYNEIPHLLIPVVTEPSKAAAALNWAVTEMDDRYKKFAEEGVRELESFNNKVRKDKDEDKVLPQVVIIIDELADLMMAAPSQVEDSICRLAQKARAAGMHLIVATQRPSVDVITGVIKANIPSRIAFAVSSQFDSRTILDMAGAEKLVGKGDMLFNPMGGGKPSRVQGTFISDPEVHNVIEFVKGQVQETEYADDVIHTIEKGNAKETADDADELLPDAIETVVSAGQASVSMLQRRFRIGYNRAARIVDMMEARGIIGPSEGSKPRQVIMTESELYALQNDTEDLEQ